MIAWAALDPDGGDVEHEHGHEVMPAASTIKLFVYSAFRRAELDPSEAVAAPPTGGDGVSEHLETPLTLADHAFLMLAVSDNASTNVLLDRLGFDAVAAEIERLGLANTRVRRKLMTAGPENETTAFDLASGLARLLAEPFAEDMLRPLRVAAELKSFLPHLLPHATVAAKWGDLDTVRHEAAYITQGDRRLVIAVCSSPPVSPDVLARTAATMWTP
ncbi:MAG: serine hydrolase [Actinobacteria bacterium]|nr:MAG: serine hydrolase [Actinomycetota bacterium]